MIPAVVSTDSAAQRNSSRSIIHSSARVLMRRLLSGFLREQLFDGRGTARAGGNHHRRLSRQERGVRIGSGIEQPADHRRAAIQAGSPKRGGAKIVRHIHLGAGANQQVGDFKVIPITRPVKGRRAIGVLTMRFTPRLMHGGHVTGI